MKAYENEYLPYLDEDSRTYRRFLSPEKEETSGWVKGIASLGAAAGLAALGYRSGAFHQVSKWLATEGKAIYRSAREMIEKDGAGYANLFSSEFVQKQKQYAAQFLNERQQMNHRTYDMERFLQQQKQLVSEAIPFHIEEGLRFQSVLHDLVKRHRMAQSDVSDISKALEKGRTGFLKFGSDDDIRFLLQQANITHQQTVNAVIHSAASMRNVSFANTPEGQKWISSMQANLNKLAAEQMQHIVKKDGAIKSTLIGHRQATVEDVLSMHSSGMMNISAETASQLQAMIKRNASFRSAVFDRNLYVKTSGDTIRGVIDYDGLHQIGRKQLEWWATTNVGSLLHLRDVVNVLEAKENASFRILRSGTVQPVLNAHMGVQPAEQLREDFVYVNGKVVRLFDQKAVFEGESLEIINKSRDVYLTSSMFGTMSKIMRRVAGFGAKEPEQMPWWKKAFSTLDVGMQDNESKLTSLIYAGTKFKNEQWEGNLIKRVKREGVSYEDYHALNRYFKKYTEGFAGRTLNQLLDYMPNEIKQHVKNQNLQLTHDDDVLQLFEWMGKNEGVFKQTSRDFRALYREYQQKPSEFLATKKPIGETTIIAGQYTRIQSGMDRIRQELSMEMIRKIGLQNATPKTNVDYVASIFSDLERQGKITGQDLNIAKEAVLFQAFRDRAERMGQNRSFALSQLSDLFQGKTADDAFIQHEMHRFSRRNNPLLERFSPHLSPNEFGDDYMIMNQAFQRGFAAQFQSSKGFLDFINQMNPFHGRKNLDEVTTWSIFNPLTGMFWPYRLQNALGDVGLGMSAKSLGSAAQMWGSLFTKRLLPAYGIYYYGNYADDQLENITGESATDRFAQFQMQRDLEDAKARDQFDSTESLKRSLYMRPGIEHFGAMPFGFGNAMSSVFAGGAPTDVKQTYSEEEMSHYFETGTDEIRKGRFWFAGSKSAYRGERITEFAPNAYRLSQSDYEYSNVTASKQETYEHSMLPTFENPLGFLRLLFDDASERYWWEAKHYYDRPYLLTGSLFNPNTMALGDIGNATIGQLLKPVKEMHPEFWGNPVLIQEQQKNEDQRPIEPIRTMIYPSGRIKHLVDATPKQYGEMESPQKAATAESDHSSARKKTSYIKRERLNDQKKPTGDYVIQETSTGEAIYVPAAFANEDPNALFEMAKADPKLVETAPRAMFDQEFAYKKEMDQRRLLAMTDPRSVGSQSKEFLENWSEPYGIWKWILMDEMAGYKPYELATIVQKADAATNLSNSFWEANLGSLGGEMSEIYRRFLRRDSGMIDFYNPIQNTMPDWLPGSNYFVDFQHGDPYQKIPHGEYRLPGEAYEKLNPLHPDETGYYGAFDKFKILADVAPWSDEYKFWKDYVEAYLEDPQLRKEAAAIKRQVAKRKKKYEFTPYRFQDATIEKQTVTIQKFLDDYTFLAKELPNQPLRLAGVDVKPNAAGILQSYVNVGDQIEIGYAKDPANRIQNDTYKTIRVVVYDDLKNINQEIIRKGQMKENQTDATPAGIHARFTRDEIESGARWEAIAHFDSPLNTKFLKVRTALESYERDQIYGKEWATWENAFFSDYILPGFDQYASYGPLGGTVGGAGIGFFTSMLFLNNGPKGRRNWIGAGIGGAIGLTLSLLHGKDERGKAWIPERRRVEQNINEYFDILKYMKFSGLYAQAKEELKQQGIDVDAIVSDIELQKQLNQETKTALEREKRQLYMDQPNGWEERKKEINQQLNALTANKTNQYLSDDVLTALSYREQAQQTLYAVDPYGDYMNIMKALPYKDRFYFTDFAKASSEEQQRILELVPDNLARIYKAMWGYGVDPQVPLDEYFQTHVLPDPNWIGWQPNYDLNDFKLKVVQQAELDLSDFNFWQDDVLHAQALPHLTPNGNQIEQSKSLDYQTLRKQIIATLQGSGLENISVLVQPTTTGNAQVQFQYTANRKAEIEKGLQQEMQSFL